MDNRFQRIEQLYHQAWEKPAAERSSFLDEACGGDLELRREVESLLDSLDQAGSFMESPALEVAARMTARSQDQQLVGRLLGAYQILSLLGKGGMGQVYLAHDTRLDRQVALKILPLDVTEDPERLKRFVREAKAASALNHPNIATIHELGQAEGVHYIVMEYVKGETLEARIRERRPELAEILDIGIQVADALDEAHRQGITHRDIKSANLMLTLRGQVKVLDFGLAKRVHQEKPAEKPAGNTESQTIPGVIMGTVDYMSPEQVLGRDVDHRADLFSLGVVLYDMTTGRLPFSGTSPTDTIGKILHTQPEVMAQFNHEVPEELERIVRKGLEKDRDLRYQHASDLRADLKRLKLDTESDRFASVVDTSNLPSRLQKRPWIWVLSGLLVLLLVSVAITWYEKRHPESQPETALTPIPLTSYPGTEDTPSFSPDGNSVAFQWCTEGPGANCDIYIKQIGVEPPSRLTNDPAEDFSPAWSPDGRFIAFLRRLSPTRAALMLIPQRGGQEMMLGETDFPQCCLGGPYLAWTPDSKWIVLPWVESDTGGRGLFLLSIETLQKRRLTTMPAGFGTHSIKSEAGETTPAFSPDGRILAFMRQGNPSSIYLLRLAGDYMPQGAPERVAMDNTSYFGLTWTPNGSEIVFSSGRWFSVGRISELWRKAAFSSAKPRKLALATDDTSAPAISRQGDRLAYVVQKSDANIWRVDLQGLDRIAGSPFQFISSTRMEFHPAYSPDGKKIAFASTRSGTQEIWVCDSDGTNSLQLTSFGRGTVKGPSWSPDSRSIVFFASPGGNSNVYVIGAKGGVPRRLTTDPANDKWPCWSQDGQWLYFDSLRSGSCQIWKMPAVGGEAVQITPNGEERGLPRESPDGKFVYYQKGWPLQCSLWRMPVGGGKETKVLDSVHFAALWTVGKEAIYFFAQPDERGYSDLRFYELATGKTSKLLTIERRVETCIAVSPDGKTILYPQVDEAGSDLMLVENFK